MPPKPSSARKKGKIVTKTQAQRDKELRELSRKVGLSSSDEDKASEVSVTSSDLSTLAGLQAKDGTTPTPLQQWLQDGETRVQPKKIVGLKSPQRKRGSHNKREMVQSPHPSSSAPYPPGTMVFSPMEVEAAEGSGQKTALTEAANEDNISSPPRVTGTFRANLDKRLAGFGLPPSGTLFTYSPLFPPTDNESPAPDNTPCPRSPLTDHTIVRALTMTFADAPHSTLDDKGKDCERHPSSNKRPPNPKAQSGNETPSNPYLGRKSAIVNEGANEVHVFSRETEAAWDGYDSALDESEEEAADSDDTPPDNVAEEAKAVKAASTREEVRRVFHRDGILLEHEQQLRKNTSYDESERVEVPCDWAKVAPCNMAKDALPLPCCETGCLLTVHPACQWGWERQQGMEVNYNDGPVCSTHHQPCPMADPPDEAAATNISSPLLAPGQFLTGPPLEKRGSPVLHTDLEVEEVDMEVHPEDELAGNPLGHDIQQETPMAACTDFELEEVNMDLPLGDEPAVAHTDTGKVDAYTEPEGHVAAPTSSKEQGG